MSDERERFYSRLSTLPGLRPMPSIGHWILIQVDDPPDLARKVNRRLAPGTVNVPRNVPGAIRVPVQDPKKNEELFAVLRELSAAKVQARDQFDLEGAFDLDDAAEAG